jgi:hypothetical protein
VTVGDGDRARRSTYGRAVAHPRSARRVRRLERRDAGQDHVREPRSSRSRSCRPR